MVTDGTYHVARGRALRRASGSTWVYTGSVQRERRGRTSESVREWTRDVRKGGRREGKRKGAVRVISHFHVTSHAMLDRIRPPRLAPYRRCYRSARCPPRGGRRSAWGSAAGLTCRAALWSRRHRRAGRRRLAAPCTVYRRHAPSQHRAFWSSPAPTTTAI